MFMELIHWTMGRTECAELFEGSEILHNTQDCSLSGCPINEGMKY